MLDAALGQFGRNGWAATTVPMIAGAADVSVDTVYAVFGTKSNLLMEVVELAIVGDDEEAPMADRPEFALLGDGDLKERLRQGVRYTVAVYERSLPILDALREAAASDEHARERYARYGQDRHDLMAAGMALMLGSEPGEPLVDALWALVSPESYAGLTRDRGWSPAQVEDWFTTLASAAIELTSRRTSQGERE